MADQNSPDEREAKFYALYGRCINQWAFVDQHYFDFFSFALGTTRRKAALLFYGYGQFGQRMERTGTMMKEVLKRKVFKPHKKPWDDILTTTRKLSEFRNELAHEPIRAMTRLTARINIAPGYTITSPIPKNNDGVPGPGRFHEVFRPNDKILGGKTGKLYKDSLQGIREGHLSDHLQEMQELTKAIEKLKSEMSQTIQQRYVRLSARMYRDRPQTGSPSE